ncbi:MAG TPA: DNA-formamidopyrimidine glycosylase family protein [Streptosporangiaceae bacterium]
MPELPEVEIARRLIADRALHRRITGAGDVDPYVRRPHTPDELRDALAGRTLIAAHRRGKLIWCETSGSGTSDGGTGPDLGIHLGMTGRIVVADHQATEGGEPFRRGAGAPRPEWNRFTLRFADGGRLTLSDPRRLGRVRLDPDIDALGPDAGEVTHQEFSDLIMRGTIAVKARLLDQSKIAGIGNLLADQVLWQAKVSPSRPAGQLRGEDADRIYRELRSALASAIANGGSHTGEVMAVRRPGGICPRCGAEMKHSVVGGRSTWWCSREQAPARS